MSRLIKAANPADLARIVSLPFAAQERALPEQPERPAAAAPPGGLDSFEPSSPVGIDLQTDIPARSLPMNPADVRHECEQAIAELRQSLERTREEADQREESAFERGLREGREEAADHSEQRLTLLAEALEALRQDHSARMAQMELLALQLAQAALGRIIGDPALRPTLIADTMAFHLDRIRRDLVLSIRVSAVDFPANERWDALTQDYPDISLERDGTLASGACMAKLKLGVLDLGLDGQWQRLCELFESFAEAEAWK